MVNTSNRVFEKMVVLADQQLSKTLTVIMPLWDHQDIDRVKARILISLSTSCLDTSGSVLLLLESGRVWDAARLSRSIMESTVRFAYLLAGPGEMDDRFQEFEEGLYDNAELKLHRKVQEFVDGMDDFDIGVGSTITTHSMLLNEEKLEQILNRKNKKERRALEDKWTLSNLLKELASKEFLPNALVGEIMFRYLKASQSLHANPLGLASYFERNHREEPNRTWADLADGVTSATLVCEYAFIRNLAVCVFLGSSPSALLKLHSSLEFDNLKKKIFDNHFRLEYGINPSS